MPFMADHQFVVGQLLHSLARPQSFGLQARSQELRRPRPICHIGKSSPICCSIGRNKKGDVSTSSWTPFGWELKKKFDSKYCKVDGYNGHYLVAGTGKTVILLIASMVVMARSYRSTLNALSRDHTVFCLELPGCGRSDSLKTPFTAEQYADWIVNFLRQMEISSVVVIGHSCSTAPAIALAQSRPDLASHLVLVSAIGAKHSRLLCLSSLFAADDFNLVLQHCPFATGGHAPRGLEKIVFGRLRGALLEIQFSIPGAFHGLHNVLFQARSFWYWIGMTMRLDMTSTAAEVQIPTLLGWGRHDYTCPLSAGKKYASIMPISRLYVSENGSHNWLIQNPEEFTDVVASFTDSLTSAQEA